MYTDMGGTRSKRKEAIGRRQCFDVGASFTHTLQKSNGIKGSKHDRSLNPTDFLIKLNIHTHYRVPVVSVASMLSTQVTGCSFLSMVPGNPTHVSPTDTICVCPS